MNDTQTNATGPDGSSPEADANAHDETTGSTASTGTGSPADETFAWTDGNDDAPSGDARATAERMVGQLQSMIDTIGTQAAPVLRQIGVKAAELAAVAADRAGPLAHRAAEATADASGRLAEKSRTWAADLRSRATDDSDGGPSADAVDADTASGSTNAIVGADDPAEEASRDQPAEGGPI